MLLSAATSFMAVVRDQARAPTSTAVTSKSCCANWRPPRIAFGLVKSPAPMSAQAEARLAGATADRIQAAGDLEISRANYVNVIGETPGKLVAPAPPGNMPASLQAAIDQAKTAHPNVVGAGYSERAAQETVKSVRGELLPIAEFIRFD